MTTNWIEQFKIEFSGYSYTRKKKILNFITTLLEKQKEEYVEMIRDYQRKDSDFISHMVCNDIINLIKSHDKTS